MKFEMPSELFERYYSGEIESYEILEDSKDKLLIRNVSFLDGIEHQVLYQKLGPDFYKRVDIIGDISKDYDFLVQEQRFEVLSSVFGLVESERNLSSFVYYQDSLKNIDTSEFSRNALLFTEQLEKIKSPDAKEVSGYFRILGDYGVDAVYTVAGDRLSVSSSAFGLDSVVKSDSILKK